VLDLSCLFCSKFLQFTFVIRWNCIQGNDRRWWSIWISQQSTCNGSYIKQTRQSVYLL